VEQDPTQSQPTTTHSAAARFPSVAGVAPLACARSPVPGRLGGGPEPGAPADAGVAAAAMVPPAMGVLGVRLLRAGDALVEGGGSRMNRRCGFSRAGSSADAGDPPPAMPVPSDRPVGEAAGAAAVRGAGPAPNRGVVARSVSSGEGRSVVMAWRAGRALMPTLGSGTLTAGRLESWP